MSSPMPKLLNSSWELLPGGQPLVLAVPTASSSGRLWARTGCQTSVTFPACASSPCPPASDYFYCLAGGSANGCRSTSDGPFSPALCTSQCVAPASGTAPQSSYTFPSFSCLTGDCAGQQTCLLSGTSPSTLFEWTFTPEGTDIYDISAVDGYNVGLKASPAGSFQARPGQACDLTSCSMDTSQCPPELQMDDPSGSGKACMSICAAVYNAAQRARFPKLQEMFSAYTPTGKLVRDLVCCSCGDNCGGTCGCDSPTCAYGCSPYVTTYPASYADRMCHVEDWPLASNGQSYIQTYKTQCPGAYSWQFDDLAGLHYCSLADYDITLCG